MLTPEQASLIEQVENLRNLGTKRPWTHHHNPVTHQNGVHSPRVVVVPDGIHHDDALVIAKATALVPALAAELKRALDENAKLRDRLAKCEPVIEIVRALQTLNRQAIADGHTEWTEAEYDAMDKIVAATLPEVTP